jgi:hypothetical protein
MKVILIVLSLSLCLNSFSQLNLDSLDKANAKKIKLSGGYITKALIELDSTILLRADMKRDHRFYGYDQPNVIAKRLILFSIFTNDVEHNPYGCKYGAYYETSGLDSLALRFVSRKSNFIQTKLIRSESKGETIAYIYFENKWFEFEK